MHKPDYRDLDKDQLIYRLQIAESENQRLVENNTHLHRMIETLREGGWQTPRPADFGLKRVNIKGYPMDGGGLPPSGDVDRKDLASKLKEASERADHWRKQYMDLLDSTGRNR